MMELINGYSLVSYNGANVHCYVQCDGEKLGMISASGYPDYTAVQDIKSIDMTNVLVYAKMNANYFEMQNSSIYGTHYGVEQSDKNDFAPKQDAWQCAYLMKNNTHMSYCLSNDYWKSKSDVDFACSPYSISIYDGKDVDARSSACGNKETVLNTQSALMQLENGKYAFAVFATKVLPSTVRAFAHSCGASFLALFDSGGSSQLQVGYNTPVYTGRYLPNVLAFYRNKTDSNPSTDKTMKGIDISNWQNGLDLSSVQSDFVIVKATEGVAFVDKTCDSFFTKAKALGKKIGFYHFARPDKNGAIAEAESFYQNTVNYFHHAIPVLDWEVEPRGDVAWAKTWLDRVYQLSNVKPMIYMSESVVNQFNWESVVNAGYRLWVAKYRDNNNDYNYDMTNAGNKPSVKWWNTYDMWQWTSSGILDGWSNKLDCNIFYGDSSLWDSIACIENTDVPPTDTGDTGGNTGVGDTTGDVNDKGLMTILKLLYEYLKKIFSKEV